MSDQDDDERAEIVDAHLDSLAPEQLRCRQLGHAWEVEHDGYFEQTARGGQMIWTRTLRCLRQCGCTRTDYFVPFSLEPFKASMMHWPSGYLGEGTGRILRQEARQADYRRTRQRAKRRRRRAS